MKLAHPILGLVVLAVTAGGGCYTVLRHPTSIDITQEQQDEAQGPRTCSDCHADADLYHYSRSYDLGWYEYYPAPWAVYYESPWWYDNYWYYPPQSQGPGAAAETRGRHMWSRGTGGGPGFLPPQGDQNTSPSGSVTSPDKPKPQDGDKPQQDEKAKKKEKRRLWGR